MSRAKSRPSTVVVSSAMRNKANEARNYVSSWRATPFDKAPQVALEVILVYAEIR